MEDGPDTFDIGGRVESAGLSYVPYDGQDDVFEEKKISKVLILRIKSGTAFESTIVGLRCPPAWTLHLPSQSSEMNRVLLSDEAAAQAGKSKS